MKEFFRYLFTEFVCGFNIILPLKKLKMTSAEISTLANHNLRCGVISILAKCSTYDA